MREKIADVFDGKVFHPAEPIDLPANTRIQITIETLPPEERETVSFLQTARSINLERPSDWSAFHSSQGEADRCWQIGDHPRQGMLGLAYNKGNCYN